MRRRLKEIRPDVPGFEWAKAGDVVRFDCERRWSDLLNRNVLRVSFRFEYEVSLIEVLFEDVWRLRLPEVTAPGSAFQFVEPCVLDIKDEGLEYARVRFADESSAWIVEARSVSYRVLE